jgi:hypothetical protein
MIWLIKAPNSFRFVGDRGVFVRDEFGSQRWLRTPD